MKLWERVEAGDCIVVGEVAQAHDGSLGMAHSFVDLVADCGVDAIKFQVHIAAQESTLEEPWRVRFSRQDDTRFDYWRRMEFTRIQWEGLAEHAAERGIAFIASPFSVAALELLIDIGQPFIKIASGEFYNQELIDAAIATKVPLGISTGMSTIAEIDVLVERCRSADSAFALFQCTSAYPVPPAEWGLRVIDEFRERYDCPVGFSDHSGSPAAGLAAAALGAAMLEVHVTMSDAAFGPDVVASLDPASLRSLVEGVRAITIAREPGPGKDALAGNTQALKSIFGRSWAPTRALAAGHVLERNDLILKKPGTGIAYEELGTVLGRALQRDVTPDHLLQREDLA